MFRRAESTGLPVLLAVLAAACGPSADARDLFVDASLESADAGERAPDAAREVDAGEDAGPGVFELTGATETLARRGGDGGEPYEIRCPAGAVAVGVVGRSGLLLDAIELVCAELLADGGLAQAVASTARVGGDGGSAFAERCPSGEVVVALRGRDGVEIDALGIDCAPVRDWGASGLGQHKQGPLHGGEGGSPFTDTCPQAFAVVQFAGRSATRVKAMQARCAEIGRR